MYRMECVNIWREWTSVGQLLVSKIIFKIYNDTLHFYIFEISWEVCRILDIQNECEAFSIAYFM